MVRDDGGAPPQRFFFVHLLKTGGTDLFTRLGGDPDIPLDHDPPFTLAQLYPNPTDGDVFTVAPQLSVDQLRLRWAARGPEIRIVMGHFPLCTAELLGGGFTTMTVLREPVERVLSFLRHHRKMTPADRDLPLEAIYEDPFRFDALIHNHMVKMLSLTVDEMTDGALTSVTFDDARLARAEENLASVDLVGVQERFEAFCADLERRYGWTLGRPFHANRTEPVPVPDSLRKRIAEDNEADAHLYRRACELLTTS